MYGLKNHNFWVMEAQSGRSGWHVMGSVPRPGELRLWAYQAIAHGADAIVFFRWRSGRFGTEQLWQGILDHDGIPRRRYQEIKQMGQELQQIGSHIEGAKVHSEAAIMLSYNSRFALLAQPNSPAFSYPQHFRDYYTALHGQQISTAIIAPDADITPYKLVIVPSLYITEPATVERLRQYVENGGVLLLTMRSGFKDQHNTVVDLPLPGLFADLCGIEIEDMDVLRIKEQRRVSFGAGGEGTATALCEVLTLKTAEAIACYSEDYYTGKPVITLNRVGKGKAIYVGTMGDTALVQQIVNLTLGLAHLEPLETAPAGNRNGEPCTE